MAQKTNKNNHLAVGRYKNDKNKIENESKMKRRNRISGREVEIERVQNQINEEKKQENEIILYTLVRLFSIQTLLMALFIIIFYNTLYSYQFHKFGSNIFSSPERKFHMKRKYEEVNALTINHQPSVKTRHALKIHCFEKTMCKQKEKNQREKRREKSGN